jgi:recombination protein RecR
MGEYRVAPLEVLIEQFEQFPSIGHKTASRLAYHVLSMSEEQAQGFSKAVVDAHKNIRRCSICCNLTDTEICSVCSDDSRDKSIICVVEDFRDVIALEKTREFHASYHVLNGVLSPLNGITPDKLCIKELLARLTDDTVKEVIMATNATVEGEATAMYISKLIKPLGIKVTRLAYGLPIGADLEYADEVTLSRAISGRSNI